MHMKYGICCLQACITCHEHTCIIILQSYKVTGALMCLASGPQLEVELMPILPHLGIVEVQLLPCIEKAYDSTWQVSKLV